ncbi:hypothetical protein CCACVL1_19246, partial [Corchorus capsularis]
CIKAVTMSSVRKARRVKTSRHRHQTNKFHSPDQRAATHNVAKSENSKQFQESRSRGTKFSNAVTQA